MATTSILPPSQHANEQAYHGFAYLFAAERIRLALQDRLDLMALGVVALVGDLQGSGSDELRITDYGNVGYSLPMTALAGETDTVTPSPVSIGYESVTLGQFGVGHSETYKHQLLSREPATQLEGLISMVPDSWLRTLRDQVTTVGATISGSVGATGTTLSVDDWLDLVTVYRTALGSEMPTAMLDPVQFDQLMKSARNDPAYQNSVADFAGLLGLRIEGGKVAQVIPSVLGLGINAALTDSIVQSGNAYQGFAFSPGGIGWARASTGPLKVANPQGAILVPEFGMVIEEDTSGSAQTKRQYRATSWFGVGLASTRTHTLSRILSAV